MLKAIYPYRPIGSTTLLARVLGFSLDDLRTLAANANGLYRLANPIIKPDGSLRQPLDAKPALKELHRRLKDRILLKVNYPPYLTGSLKGTEPKTNAELHLGKRIIICDDIKNFFPSISEVAVFDVWRGFFGFPPEVANLLTNLTTKDRQLPQGAIPSSYLANLVLWRCEPKVHADLIEQGITYSRYVDDIAMSSAVYLSKEQQTMAVAKIYGMLAKTGLKPKRIKHETYCRSERMIATKLVVNTKVSLPQSKRAQIRAAVHHLEKESASGGHLGLLPSLASVSVRVGQLNRFHPSLAAPLKLRLKALRDARLAAQQSLKVGGRAAGELLAHTTDPMAHLEAVARES